MPRRSAKEVGFGETLQRGVAVADDLPVDAVYSGLSLGVMPAQVAGSTANGGTEGGPLFSRVPRC